MKKFFFVIISLMFISFVPALGQQLSIGEPAKQSVEILLEESGQVNVKHIVKDIRNVTQVNFIPGTFSSLQVTDFEGNEVQYAEIGAENAGVSIWPTKKNILIQYQLDDVLSLKDGLWTWDYVYLATTTFIFPQSVDLVFANNRPVWLENSTGMRCHGCDVLIEYSVDPPILTEKVQWEDYSFTLPVRTLAGIKSFNFDQPSKSISFEVSKADKPITLFVPLELLWNPYDVYLDDQKIFKHEFFNNGTHVWLNIRPENPGIITIIGTSVVPEFSMLVPWLLGMSLVIFFQLRSKFSLR